MVSRGSIHDARKAVAELASVVLAAMLLGSVPFQVGAQVVGSAVPLVVDGTIEIVSWTPGQEAYKYREKCTVSGADVSCVGHSAVDTSVMNSRFAGNLTGDRIIGSSLIILRSDIPNCSLTQETRREEVWHLGVDGTVRLSTPAGAAETITSASGECAKTLPRTSTTPPYSWIGTWRQLTVGTDPTVAVAPGAIPDAGGKSSVRVEGNKIYVTDASGKVSVVTLVPATKGAPPTFSATTAGDLGDAVQRYIVTHMWEASYAHLPADQRANFVTGIPMPGELAGQTAESAVNWVKDNPAEVGLIVLSTAISVAFPLSAFANPVVATGGAAVLRSVVGTAMVAGTTGFVQSLFKTFLTTQSTGQRVGGAITKGVGDAVATVPGSLAGAGFEKAVGQGLAKAAVTAGSVVVGATTDAATQRLQASQATADAALKAPSYAGSLVAPASALPDLGGIALTFDRR